MNKNQNIQHVEDLILNGVGGINDATLFFRELEKIFSGQPSKSIKASLKWDGSLLHMPLRKIVLVVKKYNRHKLVLCFIPNIPDER